MQDHSGFIEYDELGEAMKKLHAELRDDDLREIFAESDMLHNNKLSLREFVICLALGFILELIPDFSQSNRIASSKKSLQKQQSLSNMLGAKDKLADAFQCVLEAYLFFDRHCEGVIRKDEMLQGRVPHTSFAVHTPACGVIDLHIRYIHTEILKL